VSIRRPAYFFFDGAVFLFGAAAFFFGAADLSSRSALSASARVMID